jgi:catechol 2,3-dioxygenase-like lactoylglutathione lyase family enzyme
MITAIRHTGIVVSDLDKCLNFWTKIMGFEIFKIAEEKGKHVDGVMGLKDVDVTTAKLKAPDGNLIELLKFNSHKSEKAWNGNPYSTGITHIALQVDNLDKVIEKLTKHDVEFPGPGQTGPEKYAKVVYARGPEGLILELVEIL